VQREALSDIRGQTIHKKSEMLFVRGTFRSFLFWQMDQLRAAYPNYCVGDSVVLISPQGPS